MNLIPNTTLTASDSVSNLQTIVDQFLPGDCYIDHVQTIVDGEPAEWFEFLQDGYCIGSNPDWQPFVDWVLYQCAVAIKSVPMI
jgi:hypothetical protein